VMKQQEGAGEGGGASLIIIVSCERELSPQKHQVQWRRASFLFSSGSVENEDEGRVQRKKNECPEGWRGVCFSVPPS
jgi:hypothetical protein